MDTIPLAWLFSCLAVLIFLSAFFSGSETALMTLNRYKLRHQAEAGNRAAQRVSALLERPDRLIGVILLGNNFVNILASAVATVIALRLGGEGALALGTGLLTFVVLIFAELAPKTVAALFPEKIAYPVSLLLRPLLKLLYPLVMLINGIANLLLRSMGLSPANRADQSLSGDELRTVVNEAAALTHSGHQTMLVNLLGLEQSSVEDIMVPRHEIIGLDINDDIDTIRKQAIDVPYAWLPVYRDNADNIFGMVKVRKILLLMQTGELDKDHLAEHIIEASFVPESTALIRQMVNFQRERRRMALVVDEYGDIQGLITLEDILEEVVGEFTTDPDDLVPETMAAEDGGYMVDAGISVRSLNRRFGWDLPTDGPKTLNGLILDYMETIPKPETSLSLDGHRMEVMHTSRSGIKSVRIYTQPRLQAQAQAQPHSGTPAKIDSNATPS